MYCVEECLISKVYKIHLTTFCVAVMLKVSAQLLRQSKPSQELAEVNLLFLQGIYHLSYGLKTQGKNLEKPPDKKFMMQNFCLSKFPRLPKSVRGEVSLKGADVKKCP